MPAQSALSRGGLPCGPVVEPYDGSIDPWNAPDESQGDPIATRDQGVPVGTGGCHSGYGPLNPAASAFYPMVSGPPACNPQSGCPGDPLACRALVSIAKDLYLVLLEGQPSQGCPLRMPYLGVAPGCACAAFLVVCVVHLAYYSVLVTPTTCVKFTKSRDVALYRSYFE